MGSEAQGLVYGYASAPAFYPALTLARQSTILNRESGSGGIWPDAISPQPAIANRCNVESAQNDLTATIFQNHILNNIKI
jgi:hypothetical protein